MPVAAFAMLVPFVHLATRYTQLAPLLVFLFFAGLHMLITGRRFLGGLLWSIPIAIQITPIVLLPLLVWKSAWRALGGMLVGLALTTGAVLVHQGVGRGIDHRRPPRNRRPVINMWSPAKNKNTSSGASCV